MRTTVTVLDITRCVHKRCRALFGRPLSGFISEGSRCEGSLDCGPGQRCEQDGVCRSSPAVSTTENPSIDLLQGRVRASDAPDREILVITPRVVKRPHNNPSEHLVTRMLIVLPVSDVFRTDSVSRHRSVHLASRTAETVCSVPKDSAPLFFAPHFPV